MPSNSLVLQTTHEFAISIGSLPSFYFQRRLNVFTLGPRLLQSHLHPCAPQKASQNLRIVALVLTTTSPLRGRTHFIVRPFTQMNLLSSRGQ
jgi:hypothetical protein